MELNDRIRWTDTDTNEIAYGDIVGVTSGHFLIDWEDAHEPTWEPKVSCKTVRRISFKELEAENG